MSCWPVHPQPFDDELFSSWILRAARANGQKVFSLLYLFEEKASNIHSNLDNAITPELVHHFATSLNTPFSRAYQTTLQSYEGYLFEATTKKVNRKTCILYAGIKRKALQRFPLQFCSLCLATGEPYFRKRWRVSFITVCSKHRCQLLDRCPKCGLPVNPMKHDVGYQAMHVRNELVHCYGCGFDLTQSTVQRADEDLTNETLWYESILKNGYVSLNSGDWIYSFCFFSILRHLMRVVLFKNEHLTEHTQKYDIDVLPHSYRYRALCMLVKVFQQWPIKFIELCGVHNIQYSDLSSVSERHLPFWLDSLAREEFYYPNIQPSEISIINAIDYMIAEGERLNASALNRRLGYSDSRVVKSVLKKYQKNKRFHLPYARKLND